MLLRPFRSPLTPSVHPHVPPPKCIQPGPPNMLNLPDIFHKIAKQHPSTLPTVSREPRKAQVWYVFTLQYIYVRHESGADDSPAHWPSLGDGQAVTSV